MNKASGSKLIDSISSRPMLAMNPYALLTKAKGNQDLNPKEICIIKLPLGFTEKGKQLSLLFPPVVSGLPFCV